MECWFKKKSQKAPEKDRTVADPKQARETSFNEKDHSDQGFKKGGKGQKCQKGKRHTMSSKRISPEKILDGGGAGAVHLLQRGP